MLCEKCGGRVGENGRCLLCGADNSAVDYTPVANPKSRPVPSVRVIALMGLVIVLDILAVSFGIAGLLSSAQSWGMRLAVGGFVLLAAGEITVCIFVMRRKRWALRACIGLAVAGAVGQLVTLRFLPILFKALLLYFVFHEDWDNFA